MAVPDFRRYLDAFSKPVGELYFELSKQKIPVSEVADELLVHKNIQIKNGLFLQNSYTKLGSSTEGCIVDPNTGKTKNCVLWSINHYTGLNRDPGVIEKAKAAIDLYGTGSGTSALSVGHSALHREVETTVAKLVQKEDALYFPTGYTTNLGAISALATGQDLILFDRECHASIVDGIKLSGAKFISFRHNDVEDLWKKIKRFGRFHPNVFVVVESAYSMSGDISPLAEICELKNQFPFVLYVDEAHTFGMYGKHGAGLVSELGLTDQVDFLMSTFSKATASLGGFIACEKKYRPLLEWQANSYIFQAAGSPADAAVILESLAILKKTPSIAKKIHKNNTLMRRLLTEKGFDLRNSKSPIIPIYIKDDEKLLKASEGLFEEGVFTVAVIYPAVKKGQGRLRFIVTASHTEAQIKKTVLALGKVFGDEEKSFSKFYAEEGRALGII